MYFFVQNFFEKILDNWVKIQYNVYRKNGRKEIT